MDSIDLNLDSGTRDVFTDKHEFYYEQLKKHVFSQFKNMEKELNRTLDKERYISLNGRSINNIGTHDILEENAQTYEYYLALLIDLQDNIYLSGLAGLYHQWEKELRGFIESSLRNKVNLSKKEIKNVWNISIYKIFDILKIYGWDIKSEAFYENLNACRLIVNVYKHGDGKSFDELKKKHAKYLTDFNLNSIFNIEPSVDCLWYECLRINEQEFDELAEAIKQFWEAFPERSFISSQDKLDKLLAMLKNKKKPSAKQTSKG